MSLRSAMEARIEELKRDAQETVAIAEEQRREAEEAKAQARSARTGEEEVCMRGRYEAGGWLDSWVVLCVRVCVDVHVCRWCGGWGGGLAL